MVKIESEIVIPQMNNSNLETSEFNLEVDKLNHQVGNPNLEVSKLNQVLPIWQSKCC